MADFPNNERDKRIADLKPLCLKGDESAWREMFELLYPAAMRVAAGVFCLAREEAENIAQTAVSELAGNLARIEHPLGFVARVAHNKSVDYLRKKRELLPDPVQNEEGEAADWFETVASPAPESDRDFLLIEMLAGFLGEMGEPCATLLRARFCDELSYAETAGKASIPAPQVGVYLKRCLDRLAGRLGQDPGLWKEMRNLAGG